MLKMTRIFFTLHNLPDLLMNTAIGYTLLSLYRKVNDVYLTAASLCLGQN